MKGILLFDLDNTLIDTSGQYVKGKMFLAKEIFETEEAYQTVKDADKFLVQKLGKRTYDSIHLIGTLKYFSKCLEDFNEAHDLYLENENDENVYNIADKYFEIITTPAEVFPDVHSTLEQLSDYAITLITEGHTDKQLDKIEKHKIGKYLTIPSIISEERGTKDKGELVSIALNNFKEVGIENNNTFFIDDALDNIIAVNNYSKANKIDIKSIYKVGNYKGLQAGAEENSFKVIHNVSEILEIL